MLYGDKGYTFHKDSSTDAVLDSVVNVPVVDGVRISVSRHSGSKVQHIGKIVCVAGSEIDREASITHSGTLTSSSRRGWIKRPITKNS